MLWSQWEVSCKGKKSDFIPADRTMLVKLSVFLLCMSFYFGRWEIKDLPNLKTVIV